MGSGGETGLRVRCRRAPSGALTPAGAREGRSRGGSGRAEGGERGRKGGSWVGARAGWADGGNKAGLGRKQAEAGLGAVVPGYSLKMIRMPRMKRTPAMARPPILRDL